MSQLMRNVINSVIDKSILIRVVEESLLDLFSKGKLVGTVHTCIGQELIGPSISNFLEEEDFIFSNHRGHGHYISRTNDLKGLIGEVMGKSFGAAGGIGGSQHLHSKNYYSNGIQGGTVPIAAGCALASKIQGKKDISVCFVGDGTWGEGIVYETLNIASLWEIPVLIVVENNNISQSTSSKQNRAGTIKKRVEAFDVKYFSSNTQDPDNLLTLSERAISYVRNSNKPAVLEIETDRLYSHSKGDDNRNIDKIMELKDRDILSKYIKSNEGNILYRKYQKKIQDLIIEIESEANKSRESANSKKLEPKISNYKFSNNSQRINEDIHEALVEIFKEDEMAFMLGEDIENSNKFNSGDYGGAFKVTKNLSNLFPSRVRNTPISEAAIVGIGNGLALNSVKPIVEIMFGDFLTLAFDQILNHSAKFVEMFGINTKLPILIRVPMGAKRGYGPTHSQTLENHFLGIKNLDIYALNSRIDNKKFIKKLHKDLQIPTLLIENKVLYTKKNNQSLLSGFDYIEYNFGSYSELAINPSDEVSDIAIICYGETLDEVEKVAKDLFLEEEIFATIICLTKLSQPNIQSYYGLIDKVKNIFVIEEGSDIGGFSSEIIAKLAEDNFINQKIARLGNRNIIPCYKEGEQKVIPSKQNIFNFIMEKYE